MLFVLKRNEKEIKSKQEDRGTEGRQAGRKAEYVIAMLNI